MMAVQVMIADEMDLALVGIKAVLCEQRAFQVTGTYQVLSELLDALIQVRPDVILLGEHLDPELDVLALVERVQQVAPRIPLLILGSLPGGLIVQELLNCGAAGYLYKGDPLSGRLVEAIHAVLKGRPYLSPTANAEYLLAIQSDRTRWKMDTEAREVLRLTAQGFRRKEIALKRGVPIRRIHNIFEKLRRRFGAETNEHLIARAAEEGFLP